MDKKIRVAVYCRFGCIDENVSKESLEKHYKEFISTNKNWELSEIYIDKGFGATKTRPRPALNRLINNCRNGKVDIIVTKDMSRIYRNVVDLLEFVEEMKNLNPPVRICFEDDGWYVTSSEFKQSLREIMGITSVKKETVCNG